MKINPEFVKQYIESLGYHKEVVFVEEYPNDCMFFDAVNPEGVGVSIRADIQEDVSLNEWNFYEHDGEWLEFDDIYK